MAPILQGEERILTAANKVTIVRILGIPVFVLLTVYYLESLRAGTPNELLRLWALVCFSGIALTDALDGYLARSRGEITRLGRILDPLADKALLLSALVLLTRPSLPTLRPQLPVYLTAVVISRDALLLIGAAIIHHITGTIEVRPRPTGKIATFLLMATIIWVLADGPVAPFRWLCAVTAILTATSGLQYMVDGVRQLERGGGRK